ncbi:MAG: hypothetical protein QNL54_07895 [Rhodobacterales bacterium]
MAVDKTDKTDLTAASTWQQPQNYREAVELAKWFLNKQRFEGGLDLYDGKINYQVTVARISEMLLDKYPSTLMENDDALSQDVLREALAARVESGRPIPAEFREHASAFMRGELGLNRKAGIKEKSYLHSRIVWAVAWLTHEGLAATRNDRSEPTSACDAVADALAELSLSPMTFASVKRIWLDGKLVKSVAQHSS